MLKTACRQGFSEFIKNAGFAGRMPRIVACGSRGDAFDYFKTALAAGQDTVFLLVDAEGPVRAAATDMKPWQHLKSRDNWDRPKSATDDQCHLMVQVMESWFLADVAALESYFGQHFRRAALPQNPRVEEVSKPDVESGLRQATCRTSKGVYAKGKHSFEVLAALDPFKVRQNSPYANRFLSELKRRSQK